MNFRISTLVLIGSYFLMPSSGLAKSSGITGHTGVSAALTCGKNGCHSAGSTFNPSIQIFKQGTTITPTSALTGFSYNFTLQAIGANDPASVAAGFDLGVTSGTLSISQADARFEIGELTHNWPQMLVNDSAQWNFTWVAPNTVGTAAINVCVNIVDLKKTNRNDNNNCQEFMINVTSSAVPDTTDPVPDRVPLPDVTFDTLGFLTPVTLPQVTATDNIDGVIGAVASQTGPFQVGTHVVDWTATDASGNNVIQSQNIIITPAATLQAPRVLRRGTTYPLSVYLSGNIDPASYPLSVPLLISGTAQATVDYNVPSAVSITAGNQGSVTLTINAMANLGSSLDVTLDTPVAGAAYILGGNINQSFSFSDANIAPTVSLAIVQAAGNVGHVITSGGGGVSINASASDPEGDSLSFDWITNTDAAIFAIMNTAGAQIDFDPATLADGIYNISVTVLDNGTPTAASTQVDSWVRIVTTLPVLTAIDSDADGVNDDVEGAFDTDYDGVADYLDSSTLDFILPIQPQTDTRQVVQALAGNKLRLGSLARLIDSNATLILTIDVVNSTSDNSLIPADMLGAYDFEIVLTPEHSGPVTVTLPVLNILNSVAGVIVYNDSNGWQAYTADSENYFEYADSVSGLCPAYGISYTTSGQDMLPCLAITINDGGPNDVDGRADGVIRLRIGSGGSLAASVPQALVVTPDSGGGVLYLLLFLIITFITLQRIIPKIIVRK